jgi:hypothetical protein
MARKSLSPAHPREDVAIDATDGATRITTAVVDDISPDGIARVTFAGEDSARAAGSLLGFTSSAEASAALLGSTVLVLANPDTQPVILGIVRDRVWEQRDPTPAEAHLSLPSGEARTVQLDKRRLDLEASEEIRLTCGKSSLVMRRDGSVIVRGVTIVSRALQSNKIRGGTVNIN